MKIKCGIDIIEIKRIKESIEILGSKFIERVFTKAEIEYCESKNGQKYQHYAARFATKEAVYKAVSFVLNDANTLSWQDIEVKNDDTGKPIVQILEEKLDSNLIDDIDISISHCKEYACASAVVLFK